MVSSKLAAVNFKTEDVPTSEFCKGTWKFKIHLKLKKINTVTIFTQTEILSIPFSVVTSQA